MPQEKGDRFTGKTSDYSRHRPSYPHEIIEVLVREKAIRPGSIIADIGSGTGKLAQLFLENGYVVKCIEPNAEMRAQAAKDLQDYHQKAILEGTAESTGLEDHSVDLVTAGQAFHWFNPEASAREFARILKKGGMVALAWNDRVEGKGDFNSGYEQVCRTYSHGYHRSGSQSLDRNAIDRFFGGEIREYTIENNQSLDLEGIKGRYFSSSYSLGPGDSRYGEAIKALENAFSSHSRNGFVTIKYETKLFLGIPFKAH